LNDASRSFGFLSGPAEILRKAQTTRRFELELSDGTKVPESMLQLSNAGMALVSINPKTLPPGGRQAVG
jgi:hypothetical protein